MPQASAGEAVEAVTAALEAAAADIQVDSPTTSEATPGVKPEAQPKAPTDSAPESSTEAKGSEKGPVPYDRFSSVIAEKNTLAAKAAELDKRIQSATEREDNLRTRLALLEEEKSILDSVRGLANDPAMKDHIIAIDKAIQGIEEVEEEIASGKVDETTANKKLELLIGKVEEKVDTFKTEQRSKELWEATDSMASQMLEALPEEYTDQDRRDLGEKWTSRVDWKTIDEKGNEVITPLLKDSFTKLIKEYGEPRGAMAKRIKNETMETVPVQDRPVSTEEYVGKIVGKDWGKLDEKGKPVLSEDQFKDDMAELLRKTRTYR
jgi:hypothetical protein